MLWLVVYNGALAAGWSLVLYLTISTVIQGGSSQQVYQASQWPLKISQTAAIMEIVHSASGLVRSPLFTTVVQVFSRIWALWGIIELAPSSTIRGSVTVLKFQGYKLELSLISLLVAWSISEVLRYTFYVFKELKVSPPYPLLWLRYSTFIILYPLGVASELTMAWLARPTIKDTRPLSVQLPNLGNFAFDYYWACWVIAVLYIPGLPQLYMYMLTQRKKILGGRNAGAKKQA
ncbi:hypothetical protein WJX73_001592 [Symbiochloris irregularis]|uniref:Very-long-chain (3R)-3-hydroxyacyl-CoA dehydratase n=1 Tax=Symbiochloris irregularis TaxID=706552 RepID=A0AAW1PNF3_9CHLO